MNGEEPAEEVTEGRKYDGNGRVSQATHGFVIVFMSDGTVRMTSHSPLKPLKPTALNLKFLWINFGNFSTND